MQYLFLSLFSGLVFSKLYLFICFQFLKNI